MEVGENARRAAVRFARFESSATRVPHAERDDLHAVVRGQQAVTAGLALPCSSAATEGNVNMITMIKRQMYGRAAFPLSTAKLRSPLVAS